jgi:DNA-binding transcriptional MerR regulator
VLSIGQFAQATGMTVKALRHYDERGLLVPARVDPRTRYRGYTGAQVRDAVLVKALRDAGVPVEQVRRALAGPDGVDAVLAGFRAGVEAGRRAQDAALVAADEVLAALRDPVEVRERDAGPLHHAGVALRVPLPDDTGTDAATGTDTDTDTDTGQDDDAATERANAAFADLHQRLARAGNPPVGPFWSSFAATDDPGAVELLLCWPVARPASADELSEDGGPRIRTGTLPARRELVATWTAADRALPAGVPHPAFVALLAELDARGVDVDLADVRQVGLVDGSGAPAGTELAVSLGQNPGRLERG